MAHAGAGTGAFQRQLPALPRQCSRPSRPPNLRSGVARLVSYMTVRGIASFLALLLHCFFPTQVQRVTPLWIRRTPEPQSREFASTSGCSASAAPWPASCCRPCPKVRGLFAAGVLKLFACSWSPVELTGRRRRRFAATFLWPPLPPPPNCGEVITLP